MIHWSFLLSVALWAFILGQRAGWKDGMKVAEGWRLWSREIAAELLEVKKAALVVHAQNEHLMKKESDERSTSSDCSNQ